MENSLKFTGCTISSHSCDCFKTLSEEEEKLLNDNSVIVKYNKREVLCKQGSLVDHVMYMEKGLAKIFVEDGINSLLLRIVPDRNFLGLAAVAEEHRTFPYSAMSYIDCEIRQIDVGIFRKLIAQNPAFAKQIIDILSSNSVQLYGRFFCLTYKQAYGRLADIILCLGDRIFRNCEFELPLSRKDLAELSGMSSETLIRMLKKFNDEGLIEMKGKAFTILDYERLRKISITG
ncbi:MAG: Crp/Fnr family transcriptional regulator [Marinilabiliaceae bacterium]|jgi:CRP/FNR family transcriptional regulator|nr:Crp/Fnr family transcriptional regulator [Marinilabiliaceae bacterium]